MEHFLIRLEVLTNYNWSIVRLHVNNLVLENNKYGLQIMCYSFTTLQQLFYFQCDISLNFFSGNLPAT